MAENIKLEVATPDGLALETEAEIVTAPSVSGEFGVLPGHLPLLAATQAGVLRYTVQGKDETAAVGPGFVEALPDKVLLLTDRFAVPGTIDVDAARKDLAAAEQALSDFDGAHEGAAYEELARDLGWAQARLGATETA